MNSQIYIIPNKQLTLFLFFLAKQVKPQASIDASISWRVGAVNGRSYLPAASRYGHCRLHVEWLAFYSYKFSLQMVLYISSMDEWRKQRSN
jgi:hypothetical protein